jgi:glycosyltransferase involved in cell wall biosynthesis
MGHEVHVFTTNVDGSGVSKVPVGRPVDLDGVKVWYFSTTWPRRLYRAPAMGQALNRMVSQFDIVHLHAVFLWPMWAAAVACRKAGVPYLLSPRGMMVKELIRLKSRVAKTAWINLIERSNLEHAAAIHVTAEIEALELRKFGFALPPLVTIPNGVALPTEDEPQCMDPEIRSVVQRQPLVLYLGRINWKKNLLELVRAMSKVRQGHLVIVGNDEDEYASKVATLTASLGLCERVTILPHPVLGADKEVLLCACRIFVLPSLSENFGNAALEATVRGKAIVVSDGTGIATVVREHKCGLICHPNADDIAHAINRLLSDADLAETMGNRGRSAALSNYSWPIIARHMSNVYEALLKGSIGAGLDGPSDCPNVGKLGRRDEIQRR